MVMIMILIGAQRRLQRNFHILSHGPQLVERGMNIFILVPFPLEQDKPSMEAIFIPLTGERERRTAFSTWEGSQSRRGTYLQKTMSTAVQLLYTLLIDKDTVNKDTRDNFEHAPCSVSLFHGK